jgi:hypothetical protein
VFALIAYPITAKRNATMNEETDDHGERAHDLGSLGSLAQSAQLRQLNIARGWMIFIGIVLVLWHGFELATARDQLTKELRKQGIQVFNQAEFEKVLVFVQLIVGAAIALGVVFIVLGLMVKSYPVPITILGLVLYIVYQVGLAVIDPANLPRGIIFKIIIVVALVKAIQAAFAYQREMAEPLYEPD